MTERDNRRVVLIQSLEKIMMTYETASKEKRLELQPKIESLGKEYKWITGLAYVYVWKGLKEDESDEGAYG